MLGGRPVRSKLAKWYDTDTEDTEAKSNDTILVSLLFIFHLAITTRYYKNIYNYILQLEQGVNFEHI